MGWGQDREGGEMETRWDCGMAAQMALRGQEARGRRAVLWFRCASGTMLSFSINL